MQLIWNNGSECKVRLSATEARTVQKEGYGEWPADFVDGVLKATNGAHPSKPVSIIVQSEWYEWVSE